MIVKGLGTDVEGEWTLDEAKQVVAEFRERARELGLELHVVNISTFGQPNVALIHVFCQRHRLHLLKHYACPECMKENPK